MTTLERIVRCPTKLSVGERVVAGDPGATGGPRGSSWDWEIVSVEKALASKPSAGISHVAIVARLTSHDGTAGTTGDGRDVFVEDSKGRRYRPLHKLLHAERARRRVSLHDGDEDLLVAVACALGEIGGAEAVDMLHDLQRRPGLPERARREVQIALEGMGSRRSGALRTGHEGAATIATSRAPVPRLRPRRSHAARSRGGARRSGRTRHPRQAGSGWRRALGTPRPRWSSPRR